MEVFEAAQTPARALPGCSQASYTFDTPYTQSGGRVSSRVAGKFMTHSSREREASRSKHVHECGRVWGSSVGELSRGLHEPAESRLNTSEARDNYSTIPS